MLLRLRGRWLQTMAVALSISVTTLMSLGDLPTAQAQQGGAKQGGGNNGGGGGRQGGGARAGGNARASAGGAARQATPPVNRGGSPTNRMAPQINRAAPQIDRGSNPGIRQSVPRPNVANPVPRLTVPNNGSPNNGTPRLNQSFRPNLDQAPRPNANQVIPGSANRAIQAVRQPEAAQNRGSGRPEQTLPAPQNNTATGANQRTNPGLQPGINQRQGDQTQTNQAQRSQAQRDPGTPSLTPGRDNPQGTPRDLQQRASNGRMADGRTNNNGQPLNNNAPGMRDQPNRVGDFLNLDRPLKPENADPRDNRNPRNNGSGGATNNAVPGAAVPTPDRLEPNAPADREQRRDGVNAGNRNRSTGRMTDVLGNPAETTRDRNQPRDRGDAQPGTDRPNEEPRNRDAGNPGDRERNDRDRNERDRNDQERMNRDRNEGDRDGRDGSPRNDGSPDRNDRPDRDDQRFNDRGQIDIDRFRQGQTQVNRRPRWADVDRTQIVNVNQRLQNQINVLGGYGNRHPNRIQYWNQWSNPIRNYWLSNLVGYNYFTPTWFNNHPYRWGAYSYGYVYNTRPWYYWWSAPQYNRFSTWFTWGPSVSWAQPIYYDYGPGGNVYYQDNMVYINSQPVVRAEEYAQSAALLATVEPPVEDVPVENQEWLPLGTFALVHDPDQVEPQRLVQLAVNREGVISGTLHDETSDQTTAIQGRVDKETQRVAFRVGDDDQVVYEVGLFNLTQSEAPVLVHHGTDRSENQVLVRLEAPEAVANSDSVGSDNGSFQSPTLNFDQADRDRTESLPVPAPER